MPTLTTQELQRRILGFTAGPNMLALVGVLGDRVVADIALAQTIADSWGIDDAEGSQLDALGSILQLARDGVDDARYRVLLRMQAQILLSSAGTTAVLEAIATIWAGADPLAYDEPVSGLGAEASITVPVDLTDYAPLLRWLRLGKTGGVRLNVHVADATRPMIVDYEPGDPIDDAGLIDYEPGDPIDGAATLGYAHTI